MLQRFQRYAFMLLASLGSVDVAEATTIVIMRTATGFVVGADSLSAIEADGKRLRSEQGCKLGRLGANQYLAVSGDTEVLGTRLNVWRIVEEVAARGGTSRTDAVEAELVPLMETIAPRLKLSLKVQIALFGFDGGGRLFQLNTYETKLNNGQPLSTVRREPVAADLLFFGEHAAALDTAKRTGIHPSSDPVAVVEGLIEIQIRATPDRVGPPINVLRIDSAGYQWIQGGDLCANRLPIAR